jgi:hypothetical protein
LVRFCWAEFGAWAGPAGSVRKRNSVLDWQFNSFGNSLRMKKIGLEFEFEYFSNSNFTQINSK